MSGVAARIASTRLFRGAVSLAICVSNSSPSRTDMIAIPWTAICPLTIILSPARARPGWIFTPSGTIPIPEVLIKIFLFRDRCLVDYLCANLNRSGIEPFGLQFNRSYQSRLPAPDQSYYRSLRIPYGFQSAGRRKIKRQTAGDV